MIHIGVVGYGYWGPNIVRNLSRFPSVSISWICDLNPNTFVDIPRLYPTIRTTTSIQDVLSDPTTTAVIIATPPKTHFTIANQAIRVGKHVLVEKPMTCSVMEAKKLVAIAKAKKRILMVDHTYVYTPTIQKLKKIIDSDLLGSIYYIDSVRTNLGILQKDSNVIADLAVHDFSIIDYLFNKMPTSLSATGITLEEIHQETVAHITARYPNGLFLHSHVSWLSPIKIRRMTLVGKKKMAIYDDIESSEKLKIYDKGVSFEHDPKQSYQLRIGYRNGAVMIPPTHIEEGLFGVVKEFIHAIETKKSPITDGAMGLRVVRCLTKATKSLQNGGIPIAV